MIIFLLILLFAIFKAISDTIKPDQFPYSFWSQWSGHKWIDTRISMAKDLNCHPLIYIWLIHFKYPWHLANSIKYSIMIIGFELYYIPESVQHLGGWGYVISFFLYWLVLGSVFEFFRKLLKTRIK